MGIAHMQSSVTNLSGVQALDYYMVEIFQMSGMQFNPSMATIIVRIAELFSKAATIKNLIP